MSEERLEQTRAAIPLVLTLVLTVTYGVFFNMHLECRWGIPGCKRIEVSGIYLPETDIVNRYPEDKTTTIEQIEASLRAAAEDVKKVAGQSAERLRQREELQQRAFDVSTRARHLADLPQPSEQETKEYERVKDVYGNLEREKREADALLEMLKVRKERLDGQVKNLSARLEGAHKRVVEQQNSRLIWVLFTALFVFTILGVFFVALYLPYKVSGHGRHLVRVLALLYAVYALLREGFDWLHQTVFEDMVRRLFEQNPPLPAFYSLFDLLGNTAAFALVVTTFFILRHPQSFFRKEEEKFDAKLAELATRRNYLRVILYVGTALLVIGILRMRVLLDWLQSSILQPELSKSVGDFSKIFITFQGVFYTLLLTAVYLPARQIIANRARSLPFREEKKQEDEKESKSKQQGQLEEAGFGPSEMVSYKDYLPRLAALLAPMLVGPVAELVQKIFE